MHLADVEGALCTFTLPALITERLTHLQQVSELVMERSSEEQSPDLSAQVLYNALAAVQPVYDHIVSNLDTTHLSPYGKRALAIIELLLTCKGAQTLANSLIVGDVPRDPDLMLDLKMDGPLLMNMLHLSRVGQLCLLETANWVGASLEAAIAGEADSTYLKALIYMTGMLCAQLSDPIAQFPAGISVFARYRYGRWMREFEEACWRLYEKLFELTRSSLLPDQPSLIPACLSALSMLSHTFGSKHPRRSRLKLLGSPQMMESLYDTHFTLVVRAYQCFSRTRIIPFCRTSIGISTSAPFYARQGASTTMIGSSAYKTFIVALVDVSEGEDSMRNVLPLDELRKLGFRLSRDCCYLTSEMSRAHFFPLVETIRDLGRQNRDENTLCSAMALLSGVIWGHWRKKKRVLDWLLDEPVSEADSWLTVVADPQANWPSVMHQCAIEIVIGVWRLTRLRDVDIRARLMQVLRRHRQLIAPQLERERWYEDPARVEWLKVYALYVTEELELWKLISCDENRFEMVIPNVLANIIPCICLVLSKNEHDSSLAELSVPMVNSSLQLLTASDYIPETLAEVISEAFINALETSGCAALYLTRLINLDNVLILNEWLQKHPRHVPKWPAAHAQLKTGDASGKDSGVERKQFSPWVCAKTSTQQKMRHPL